VLSTTGSRGVRISGSNAGYTMFRGSVKGTGYLLHSPVSPSLPPPTSRCAITFQLDSTAFSAVKVHYKLSPLLSGLKNDKITFKCALGKYLLTHVFYSKEEITSIDYLLFILEQFYLPISSCNSLYEGELISL